jgi:hypothetical protein
MDSRDAINKIKMDGELFDGLKALAEAAFPKSCACCGRVYETVEEFLQETDKIPTVKSSMKSAIEDDGSTVVEVFRNCPCGSTLMDDFNDRRDMSEKGNIRRQHFNRMMDYLETKGLTKDVSRAELINGARGEKPSVLSLFRHLKLKIK